MNYPSCSKKITHTVKFDCDLNTMQNTVVSGKTTVFAFSKLFVNSNTAVEWYLSDYESDIYYKQYNI